jgi:cyclopropane fatty-acyl-phospholipid synthase-like methyltransferase
MRENWSDENYAAHYNRLYATPAEEFQACLDLLAMGPEDSLVDFGCGNGDFLALAADRVASALGVDLSGPQLEIARSRLSGRPGVEILQSTFLDFDPGARRFTRGFSRKALHHLTDSEKELFLARIGPAFQPGALFLLEDGMFFGFEREELEANWDVLVAEAQAYYGDSWEAKKPDILHSFRNEFPTGVRRWERIFEKAGFTVTERRARSSFYGTLLAVKRQGNEG